MRGADTALSRLRSRSVSIGCASVPAVPPRPVLVCIAGGSASGKSTISRALVERLGGRSCAVVNVDDYFRDWSFDEELRTANRPEAVLWPALIADLDRLLDGEEIE